MEEQVNETERARRSCVQYAQYRTQATKLAGAIGEYLEHSASMGATKLRARLEESLDMCFSYCTYLTARINRIRLEHPELDDSARKEVAR